MVKNQKILIYSGILLLVSGIVLRSAYELAIPGMVLIILGVSLKTIYILLKLRSGDYKPGVELIMLAAGLSLFFTAKQIDPPWSIIMKVSGIVLKVAFVVIFIRKSRRSSSH